VGGVLALFGIASDDGVLIATFPDESFASHRPRTVAEIREAVLAGVLRRIRPALTTTATTLPALVPVLSSTGRGSGIMVPMAIPPFGGMPVALLTVMVVCCIAGAKKGGPWPERSSPTRKSSAYFPTRQE